MLLLLAKEMLVLFWCSVNSAAVVPFRASGFRVGGMLVILCDGKAWLFSDSEMCKTFKRQNISRVVLLNFPFYQISDGRFTLICKIIISHWLLHVNTDGVFYELILLLPPPPPGERSLAAHGKCDWPTKVRFSLPFCFSYPACQTAQLTCFISCSDLGFFLYISFFLYVWILNRISIKYGGSRAVPWT